MTSYGFIDTVSLFFNNIRGPLDDEQQIAEMLNRCLNLMISVIRFLNLKYEYSKTAFTFGV